MSKITIKAEKAPAAIGPYSHAVQVDNTLYISGQLGLIPSTGEFPEGTAKQAEQSLINMGEILKTSGMDYSNVVKTTIFLANMDDFALVNEVYGKYFTTDFPARSCIEVAKLPRSAEVEIEAIAVKF